MLAHETNGHAAGACPRCGFPAAPATEAVNNYGINHPPDLMARYAGKHVAWSMDGREVLAVADSTKALLEQTRALVRQGIDHVHDYVPHPDDPPVF